MKYAYPSGPAHPFRLIATSLLLLAAGAASAQPTITALAPVANARAVPRTSPVAVSFSQALTAGSGAALKVYSAQRGGLRTRGATPAIVNGSSLSFAPTAYPFMPGETVRATVTTAAASGSGSLARGLVTQFTAAAGGSGRGFYGTRNDAMVGRDPYGVALGDVDGDGDLDAVTSNYGGSTGNTASVLLNGGDATGSNTGIFSNGSTVAVAGAPNRMTLGDVDGDGDLDLLTANSGNTVSVRLNNGAGEFGNGSDCVVGTLNNYTVALGDVDGDGDLDFVASNLLGSGANVRLNGGDATGSNTGVFSNGTAVALGGGCYGLALGDMDNDGDLDLVATSTNNNGTLQVRLNNGQAVFSGTQAVAVGSGPASVALGDVDGDGDLDALTSNRNDGSVSVVLNGGNATATFGVGSTVVVGTYPETVTLGDVDGDGDLDLATANGIGGTVSVRLNGGNASGGGTGRFNNGPDVAVQIPTDVTMGDVDGDGDLDLVAAQRFFSPATPNNGSVGVQFNLAAQPLANAGAAALVAPRLLVGPTVATDGPPQYTFSGALGGGGATVGLYSLLGQRLWQQPAAAAGLLPVTGLASGWYVVRLRTAAGSYSARVLVP